jgi:hypothetical protein
MYSRSNKQDLSNAISFYVLLLYLLYIILLFFIRLLLVTVQQVVTYNIKTENRQLKTPSDCRSSLCRMQSSCIPWLPEAFTSWFGIFVFYSMPCTQMNSVLFLLMFRGKLQDAN